MKNLLSIMLLIAALSACKKSTQQTNTNYDVNNTASKISWKGSASDHFHVGSFSLNGSVITNSAGVVNSGDFTIPVSSIMDDDLPEPMKEKLLDDLKSADFFNIATFADTKFTIDNIAAYTGTDTSAVQGANYLLTGDFTMVGQTHSLTFPAKIIQTGDSLITEARFKLDRTKWGMNSYNDPSKALYIYPDVDITLNIRAGKAK